MAANRTEEKRNQFLQQVARIDSQIMHLQDEMLEAMQRAVDLDRSMLGEISDITRQFVETFRFRITDLGAVVSEHSTYAQEHAREQAYRTEDAAKKRIMTQDELDRMIAGHREKRTRGIYETLDLSGCILDGLKLTGAYDDVSFMGSELNGCELKDITMENCILSKADLMGCTLKDCVFDDTVLIGTNMGYCKITDMTCVGCSFSQASFVMSNVRDSEFCRCEMAGALISDSRWEHIIAYRCQGKDNVRHDSVNEDCKAMFDDAFIDRVGDIRCEIGDSKASLDILLDGTKAGREVVGFSYDLDTHVASPVGSVHPGSTAGRAARMLQMDIQRELQKLQFQHKRIMGRSPVVMVHSSDCRSFQEERLYDLKEFNDRISTYEPRTKVQEELTYSIAFRDSEGRVKIWQDRYMLGDRGAGSLSERIRDSGFFNGAELIYLSGHISGDRNAVERDHGREGGEKGNVKGVIKGRADGQPLYVAFAYTDGKESRRPVRLTGDHPDKIIALCKEYNADRKADDQLGTAYIQKYEHQSGQYVQYGKYDVKTGADVTPIYLKLPHMSKEKFDDTIAMFRKNGARFSTRQRAWYITRQQDSSVFSDYIVPADAREQQGRRTDVLGSLDRNKSSLESAQRRQQCAQRCPRKKEDHVL